MGEGRMYCNGKKHLEIAEERTWAWAWEWNGMEWNGMEWNGMEWHGMAWHGMAWHGMEWNGMEWNGMEWNGMEWNGMEWNGMEWNGMEWRRTRTKRVTRRRPIELRGWTGRRMSWANNSARLAAGKRAEETEAGHNQGHGRGRRPQLRWEDRGMRDMRRSVMVEDGESIGC